MKIKQVTESPKSLSRACAFYGLSTDAYRKWGTRLKKQPRIQSLFSKSRKPYRSPNRTKPRKTKKVIQLRRQDPHLGPERISEDLKRVFNMNVAPSTVYAILRREKMVSQKRAQSLTKRHLKRYRRVLPGYLQMDFKYVPYRINGEQLYQLSCVDHHSSWRLIRIYGEKNIFSVRSFLKLLMKVCPFPIIEIQTDNDTAFTDKFSSGMGVTGEHEMDHRGCTQRMHTTAELSLARP
jgi:transposase